MEAELPPTADDRGPLLAAVRERLRALRREPGYDAGPDRFLERVRTVVVIGSSSRGGSSIFAEILRRTPQLLHFRAEVNPFFVLAGLSWPESGTGCDALCAMDAPTRTDDLSADLAFDCGTALDTLPDEASVARFVVDLTVRLTLQWPTVAVALPDVRAAVAATLATLEDQHGWPPGGFPDAQLFHVLFLARMRRIYPTINPHYYDISRALVELHDPTAPLPDGPPSLLLIEEPPFVPIVPWRRASIEALGTRPVIVKTPSNAYRLPFLQALFPNAEIKLLHLTRNVAASVNGLYDGWRFPGFYSHRVHLPLRIAGYTDTFPAWGDRWWKFDLPPNWQAWTDRDLEEVCAFQWRSAHRAILDWIAGDPARRDRVLRLRFEDVVGARERREDLFGALAQWLGITLDPPLTALLDGALPPVMATEAPRHRRWFKRADLLSPVLSDPLSRELMEQLGYASDPTTWA
ncbi:MAG: sulfotransferase [Pseudomonadota bacterium]|nr:sulfotransferase [Pseudomonadota bacterium]